MRLSERVVGAMGWDTAGALATSAITFVTTVWMVRLLGPATFAAVAALLALLGLAQVLAASGARTALLRFIPAAGAAGAPSGAAALLRRALAGRAMVLVVVAVPLWLGADTITALLLGRAELARYVRLLPALVALPLYVDLLATCLVALYQQRAVRAAHVANKLVFAAALLLVPRWADPIHGVFAAWLSGWVVAAVWLTVEGWRHGLGRGGDATVVTTERWRQFSGTAYGLAVLAVVLGRELDILLLTRLGVAADGIALYAVSFSFVATVLALPLLPIAGGFDVPLIAGLYHRDDWPGLRRLFRAFFEYVYILMLPLVGGGLLLAPDLVTAIYGSAYAAAAPVVLPLLVLLGVTKLGGVTAPFLLATDHETTLLRIRITMAALNVALALVAIPRWGPAGAALATGAAMLGMVAWEAVVVQRVLHPRYPWAFLTRVLAAVSVMMLAVALVRPLAGAPPRAPGLAALVGVGLAVYVAMLAWLRPVSPEHGDLLARGGVPRIALLLRRIGRPA